MFAYQYKALLINYIAKAPSGHANDLKISQLAKENSEEATCSFGGENLVWVGHPAIAKTGAD